MNRTILPAVTLLLCCCLFTSAQEKTLEQKLIAEGVGSLAKAARESGDAKAGAVVFHRRRSTCTQCHATGDGPSPLGPNLAVTKSKVDYVHIVESVLTPSKVVEAKFQTVQILTDEGRLHVGMIAAETPEQISLRNPAKIGEVININKKQIDDRVSSRVSLMPQGVVNRLEDRQQFLDLVAYLAEIAKHGPEFAKQIRPDVKQLEELAYEQVDHVAAIKSLRYSDQKAGRALYALNCASCHGKDGNLAINPLARRFAKDEFKFGGDPYALWKTISYGNGLMFRWDAVLTAKQRYQLVHFIREEIVKEQNPKQYFTPSDEYFEKLPAVALADAKADAADAQKVAVAPGMIDGTGGKNMIYGPLMQHGFAYTEPKNKNAENMPDVTEKAIVVKLPGGGVICYDAHRLSVSGMWQGKAAITDNSHHTSYKGGRCLLPGGEPLYKNVDAIGWALNEPKAPPTRDHFRYNGLHLFDQQVVLNYTVGGRQILELPRGISTGQSDNKNGQQSISRTFQVEPGDKPLFCLVASNGLPTHGDNLIQGKDGTTWLKIPAAKQTTTHTVVLGDKPANIETVNLSKLTQGGPRRWAQTVQTAVAPGESIDGYAFDQLTVPLANPWGCWMRTTALDFFSDGRMAVSTLSGDVWIVSWTKQNPGALTWSRYAAGLYEPLGLKVVDDIVYVRGRDRITRLHDLNRDGEADFYENFYEEPNEIGASYHAFIYELQTDKVGNFYFSQSGYKSPLTGAVVKVDPDGKRAEFIGTDLRNPNGMGVGGPHDWITVADNPSGKAVYNGFFLAEKNATYGYAKERTVPMLVTLPSRLDSSSGGQCWTSTEGWGPLGGSVIHTSYSRCVAFYCFIQDVQPYPNGFAVQFPFPLKSGGMRPRVHPLDKQVYLTCQKGWGTSARHDAAIYRIRYTGETTRGVCDAAVTSTGLQLTFAADLDPASVKASAFSAIRESDKKEEKDPDAKPPSVKLGAVRLIGTRTVHIDIPKIENEDLVHRTDEKGVVTVNPPISLTWSLQSKDGSPVEQTIHATVNTVPTSAVPKQQ